MQLPLHRPLCYEINKELKAEMCLHLRPIFSMDATRFPMNVMTTFTETKMNNIGYTKMVEETNMLSGLASQMSNEHCHVVY